MIAWLMLASALGACTEIRGNPSASSADSRGGGPTADAAYDSDSAANGGAEPTGAFDAGPESDSRRSRGDDAAQAPPRSAGGGSGTAGAADGGPRDPGAPPASESPADDSVRGRVIDIHQRPVEFVTVTIGASSGMTDESGEFRLSGVASPYAVLLTLPTPSVTGVPQRWTWLFEGLTRRDPTLQVVRGRPDRSAPIDIRVAGVDFANQSPDEVIWSSFAGEDGDFADQLTSETTARNALWSGPTRTRMTGHALRLLRYEGTTATSEFLAYDSATVDLIDGQAAPAVSFDLTYSAGNLPIGTVSGTLGGAVIGEVGVHVYLRFSGGATLELLSDYSGAANWNHFVPSVPETTLLVLAAQGGNGYQRVYREVSSGTAGVTLDMPTATELLAPGDGASGIDGETQFEWMGAPRVYVLEAYSDDGEDVFTVITAQTQARLPVRPQTLLSLPANREFDWYVETHGAHRSVDEATGPTGFVDTFANFPPSGPRPGDGSFTRSAARKFVSRP